MFSSKNSISPQAGYTDLVLGVHYVCRRPLVGDSNVEQGKGLDHSVTLWMASTEEGLLHLGRRWEFLELGRDRKQMGRGCGGAGLAPWC